jgi:hypothetical protein
MRLGYLEMIYTMLGYTGLGYYANVIARLSAGKLMQSLLHGDEYVV